MNFLQRGFAQERWSICVRTRVLTAAMLLFPMLFAPRSASAGVVGAASLHLGFFSGSMAIRSTKIRKASAPGTLQQTPANGSRSRGRRSGSASSGQDRRQVTARTARNGRTSRSRDASIPNSRTGRRRDLDSEPVSTRTRLSRARGRDREEEMRGSRVTGRYSRARLEYEPPSMRAGRRSRRGYLRESEAVSSRIVPERSSQRRAGAPRSERPAEASSARGLSVDDFVRAAGGQAQATDADAQAASSPQPQEAPASEGVSHPLADRQPAETVRTDRAHAAIRAVPETPAQRRPVPLVATRVDGFGAEGVPEPALSPARSRTVKRTTQPPPISAAERAEITDEAVKPMVLPGLYSPAGRLVVPAPLKGSHEILVHQNRMADQAGLERIQDDAVLERLRAGRQLVSFPESGSLRLNPELPYNRRYARPWTVQFAVDLSRQFYLRFHEPLQVNSAVRTVEYQLRLQRVNGNAAPVDGDVASPHLTGQAIDIGKRGMSMAQIAWMRAYLIPLIGSGKIDVEEEFQQACFHISVYRGYVPQRQLARIDPPQAQSSFVTHRTNAETNTSGAGEAEPNR